MNRYPGEFAPTANAHALEEACRPVVEEMINKGGAKAIAVASSYGDGADRGLSHGRVIPQSSWETPWSRTLKSAETSFCRTGNVRFRRKADFRSWRISEVPRAVSAVGLLLINRPSPISPAQLAFPPLFPSLLFRSGVHRCLLSLFVSLRDVRELRNHEDVGVFPP